MYKDFAGLSYIFDFESPVLSSNGGIEGNRVTWRNISGKNSDPGANIVFFANLKSDGTAKEDDDGKPCGLFGFEFPIILLGGLVYFLRVRGKNP